MGEVHYYTKDGAGTPDGYISSLKPSEEAEVRLKLKHLVSIPPAEWRPIKWVKHLEGNLFRIRQGNHRVFFSHFGEDIVVVHAMRKYTDRYSEGTMELVRERCSEVASLITPRRKED